MKITKSQLKQIIKEEMNKTISAGQPQQGELLFERNVPSFRQFLGYLGLQMAITAPALGLVASQIPDSSPEDSTEEVLKDRAAERLVDMGPEKAKEVINKFGPENEEIKDVFTRYNDKVRAEGGYTDEPDPASSWKENKMKITKSQLKQIIKEELESALQEQELNEVLDPSLLTPENFETLIQAVKHGVTQKEVLYTIIGVSGWQLLKQLGIVPKMSEDEAALAPEDEV